MFTRIVKGTEILLSAKGGSSGSRLVIRADRILEDIEREDNIAVNGVCLTTASFDSDFFLAGVISEALRRSNLGCLPIKSSLSLERAMIAGGRFDGHIVSGHIDGTGTIANVVRDGNTLWYTIRSTPSILRRIVKKGPITIDGVSLMVAQVREQGFGISLIPHIASHTTLGVLKPGRVISLESGCVRKCIEKFVKISPFARSTEGEDTENRGTDSRITPELLKQYGF